MRFEFALPLLACLSGCSGGTATTAVSPHQALAVACVVDGVLVPIGQPIVASLGPHGVTAANLDSLLIHPAVTAACNAINGTPASVTPVAPPAPNVAAASQ